ncbi:MAG: hypothetical protein GY773_26595, partial [Actinomycetia bacterium]|nr:hypothetical protein [Actinomycetes bacterium]
MIDGFRGDSGEIYGTDYVTGDPLFVDAAGANFHPQAGSPAIDQGSDLAAPGDDVEGNARPQDGNGDGSSVHDIGAYEVTPPFVLTSATDPHPVKATTELITYTITLLNQGRVDATGVTITSTVPNSTTHESGGDIVAGANVIWTGQAVA